MILLIRHGDILEKTLESQTVTGKPGFSSLLCLWVGRRSPVWILLGCWVATNVMAAVTVAQVQRKSLGK